LVGTVGLLKDTIHRNIVRRIATTALSLAAGSTPVAAGSVTFAGTYATLEEAVSQLPQTMVSLGSPGMMAFPDPVVGAAGILTPSGILKVQWEVAEPTQNFDWPGYLSHLPAAP
jgi:hypothetical protein